jgi:hypothetical protein
MTRRTILQALGTLPLAASVPAFGQGEQRYDILIKNGEVHDPARGFRQKADVAVLDGKVAAIETSIPAERGIGSSTCTRMFTTG